MLKALILIVVTSSFASCNLYQTNVVFTVYKNLEPKTLAFNESLSGSGCSQSEKLAIISHGWLENMNSAWARHMIGNLTAIRGGCVIFIDYSFYGNNSFYFAFLLHFESISAVLTKRLHDFELEGFDPNDWFMFGHSAGARLVIDAAANFGHQKVNQIDVCELAGPGFDFRFATKHPQKAAKNVQCIHTSAVSGSVQRLCHQDWLMGVCGRQQPGTNVFKYMYCQRTQKCDSSYHISHGLCPHFYNSAFKNDFVADNSVYKCGSQRAPTLQLDRFKMGYMESRKSPKIIGDFFAPTTAHTPWNDVGNAIKSDDKLMDLMLD